MVYLWRAVDARARLSMCWSSPSATSAPLRKLLRRYAFVRERLATDELAIM
jgi:hypothetical protein